ncbi:MAG TPA: M23 family metallopeptidase [Pyrinomonadaceae bacterium]|nr:M23 family metallopeptidase [Pyrinomonadaceae bacterium]
MALSPRLRVLLLALAVLAALVALIWYLTTRYGTQPVTPRTLPQGVEQTTPTPATAPPAPTNTTPAPVASPAASPGVTASPGASPSAEASPPAARGAPDAAALAQTPATASDAAAQSAKLLVPVAGVRPEQLQDTFTQSRSEGRVHNAIDIPAPRGTPVLAVADGRIIKLFNSKPGGITIYQLADDNRTVYYYAHLERYADGLAEGGYARRGETIAYVGDTGNAGAGNYHLHFSVSLVSDPKRWWSGQNINPYPLFIK